MKRFVSLILCFALLAGVPFIWMTAETASAESTIAPVRTEMLALGLISKTDVIVRAGASTDNEVVTVADAGDNLMINAAVLNADETVWYEVQVDGGEYGYIRSDLIEVVSFSSDSAAALLGTVSRSDVNVRAGSSKENEVVAVAALGEQLPITSIVMGSDYRLWFEVVINGAAAYIRNDMITFDPSGVVQPAEQPAEQQPVNPGHLSLASSVDEGGVISNPFVIHDPAVPVQYSYIRFVSQIPGSASFNADLWKFNEIDLSIDPSALSGYAALSMQMSYFGMDCTPGKMSAIMAVYGLADSDFRPAVILDHLIQYESYGITHETVDLNTGALTPSQLEAMMTSYETNGYYSPLCVEMETAADNGAEKHAVVIVSRSGETYYAVDSGSETGMNSFQITEQDGVMYIAASSNAAYEGSRITSVSQIQMNH